MIALVSSGEASANCGISNSIADLTNCVGRGRRGFAKCLITRYREEDVGMLVRVAYIGYSLHALSVVKTQRFAI